MDMPGSVQKSTESTERGGERRGRAEGWRGRGDKITAEISVKRYKGSNLMKLSFVSVELVLPEIRPQQEDRWGPSTSEKKTELRKPTQCQSVSHLCSFGRNFHAMYGVVRKAFGESRR